MALKKCFDASLTKHTYPRGNAAGYLIFIFNFRPFVLEKREFLVSLGVFFNPGLLNTVNVDLLLVGTQLGMRDEDESDFNKGSVDWTKVEMKGVCIRSENQIFSDSRFNSFSGLLLFLGLFFLCP